MRKNSDRGKLQSGFSEGALVSPELLSWYQVNSFNLGLDMAFFNNRLKGTFDYFYYVTKGGLMSPETVIQLLWVNLYHK